MKPKSNKPKTFPVNPNLSYEVKGQQPVPRKTYAWIITIKDTDSIYFEGTLRQVDVKKYELKKHYNTKAWVRYADAKEIKQQKCLRPFRKGEAVVTFNKQKIESNEEFMARQFPGITIAQLKGPREYADKREKYRKDMKATQIRLRDERIAAAELYPKPQKK